MVNYSGSGCVYLRLTSIQCSRCRCCVYNFVKKMQYDSPGVTTSRGGRVFRSRDRNPGGIILPPENDT